MNIVPCGLWRESSRRRHTRSGSLVSASIDPNRKKEKNESRFEMLHDTIVLIPFWRSIAFATEEKCFVRRSVRFKVVFLSRARPHFFPE